MRVQVAVRTDAYFELGMGHLMRCVTLTEQLPINEFNVTYFISDRSKLARSVLDDKDLNVVVLPSFNIEEDDANWICEYLNRAKIKCDYVIVDHYSLGLKWETILEKNTNKIVVIDDLANRQHNCDYLIDSALNRHDSDYKSLCNPAVELLLGEQYAILKPTILLNRKQALEKRRTTTKIVSILVSFGATDPKNHSQLISNILLGSGFTGEIHILTTSLNRHLNGLNERYLHEKSVVIHSDIDYVADLIVKMDLAIGALGGSAIERVALVLPSICLTTEDNQISNAKSLSEVNTVILTTETDIEKNIEHCLLPSFMSQWHKMVDCCLLFYDGLGVNRLAHQVFNVRQNVVLTTMKTEHCEFLFNLQCEKGNRLFSGNEKTPSWLEHKSWLELSLLAENRRMWVISYKGYDAGYIRLDDMGDIEEVSILVSQRFRRLGLAQSALEIIKSHSKYSAVLATVHPENTPSLKLFLNSRFKKQSPNAYIWKL